MKIVNLKIKDDFDLENLLNFGFVIRKYKLSGICYEFDFDDKGDISINTDRILFVDSHNQDVIFKLYELFSIGCIQPIVEDIRI